MVHSCNLAFRWRYSDSHVFWTWYATGPHVITVHRHQKGCTWIHGEFYVFGQILMEPLPPPFGGVLDKKSHEHKNIRT